MKVRTAPPPGAHQLSLPTPYPVGRSNAYLLEGDPPVLVDCGVRSSRAMSELEAGLGESGVRIGPTRRIVVRSLRVAHWLPLWLPPILRLNRPRLGLRECLHELGIALLEHLGERSRWNQHGLPGLGTRELHL